MLMEEILCCLFIWFISNGHGDIITDPPVDSTTCYGGIVTFTCGSDKGNDIVKILWTIDGEDVNGINTTERGISNHTDITDEYAVTTLTIVGLHDNHDIVVGCAMVTNLIQNDNKGATFTVTDIPPVTNLTIEFTGATMITTWQAPTVLPVDYHYQINISYGSVPITNTTVDPAYSIDITTCSNTNYTVSVSVVDIGYTQLHSEYTTSTTEYDVYEDIQFFQDQMNVTFVNSTTNYIKVKCKINDLQCLEGPYMYIEYARSILPPGITFNRTVNLGSCRYTGYYCFGPYGERFTGNLTTMRKNSINSGSNIIGISTFHVQNVTLDVLSDTTVQLTCFFALNSSADGCNVTFNSINQSVLVSVFILKNNTIAVNNYTGIPEGDSVVNVYDVVEGVISNYPAVKDKKYTVVYPKSYRSTSTEKITNSPSIKTKLSNSDEDSSNTSNRTPVKLKFPIWAKVLIAAVLVTAVIAVLIILSCICYWKKKQNQKTLKVSVEN